MVSVPDPSMLDRLEWPDGRVARVTGGDYKGLLALVVPETAGGWIIYMCEDPVPADRDPIQWDWELGDDESYLNFVRDLYLNWLDGDEERWAEAAVFDLRRTWSARKSARRRWFLGKRSARRR